MNAEPLLLPIVVPLALAGVLLLPGRPGAAALRLAPWAGLAGLAVALMPAAVLPAVLPWLLLGSTVGLDMTGQAFLFLASLLWTTAGVYAARYMAGDERERRFFLFFLLAMAGSNGMPVAQDAISFYLLFALMTFSAYPLVIHSATPEAFRAGRIYIVLAVVGEALLLLGLLLAAHAAETLELAAMPSAVAASPARDVIVALLLGGFGIKAGSVPLHVWLPLAHPVAPTPASAVLSGVMIKAGLLGWLRFLPLGHADLNLWGALLIVLGLGAAFFGVIIGITQRDPKIALAYSSISQMGLINIALGAGLAEPAAWLEGEPAALTYALHHGLAKGSLFLAVGVAGATVYGTRARRMVLVGAALPALALAGAPLTSGALAKLSLKAAAAMAPPPWEAWLDVLLPVAAIGTTLLMLRVLTTLPGQAPATRAGAVPVAHGGREPAQQGGSADPAQHGGSAEPAGGHTTLPAGHAQPLPGLWLPWLALLAGVGLATYLYPPYIGLGLPYEALRDPASVWVNLWPIGIGVVLFVGFVVPGRVAGVELRPIAAGDMLVPVERVLAARLRLDEPVIEMPAPAHAVATLGSRWYGLLDERERPAGLDRLAWVEAAMTRWTIAGLAFLGLLAALLVVWLWR